MFLEIIGLAVTGIAVMTSMIFGLNKMTNEEATVFGIRNPVGKLLIAGALPSGIIVALWTILSP